MVKLKKVTKKKLLWLRTIASSILGEGVDSFLFVLVAFLGIMDRQALLAMILSQWLFKVSYEILITPLLYLAINKIQDIESQSVQKK